MFAIKRKDAISKYCWNEKENFILIRFIAEKQKTVNSLHLPQHTPLFFQFPCPTGPKKLYPFFIHTFVLGGGSLSPLQLLSAPAMDAPNGWAPLQWIAIRGF